VSDMLDFVDSCSNMRRSKRNGEDSVVDFVEGCVHHFVCRYMNVVGCPVGLSDQRMLVSGKEEYMASLQRLGEDEFVAAMR
jgi:hypothetical protein